MTKSNSALGTNKKGISFFNKKETRNALVAYSFIAPNFIGFCIFTLIPILYALILAFMEWNGVTEMTFVGLDNFARMFTDKDFQKSFWNTILYVCGTVPLTIVCALGLALLLNQKVIGRNFFRITAFFPYVASMVAVTAVWNFLFSPALGPVNQLLSNLGVEDLPKWAAGSDTAMLTVILFSVWKLMGYYMIIYLAGLQGINSELYEAADIDGANAWQKFWNVTLPQLSSTTFFVVIMVVIQSFKVFDLMYMITQGGPGTSTIVLVYKIYNEAFVGTPEYGYSSAISMILFLMVLTVTIIQFRGNKAMNNPNPKPKKRRGRV